MLHPNKQKLNWRRVNQSPSAGQSRQVPANRRPEPGATRRCGPHQLSTKGRAATAQRPGPPDGKAGTKPPATNRAKGAQGTNALARLTSRSAAGFSRIREKPPPASSRGRGKSPFRNPAKRSVPSKACPQELHLGPDGRGIRSVAAVRSPCGRRWPAAQTRQSTHYRPPRRARVSATRGTARWKANDVV